MTTVVRPTGLDGDSLISQYASALQVKSELETKAEYNDTIRLDLSTARWFTPSFLTTISVVVNSLSEADRSIEIYQPNGIGVRSYLQMIDFPEGTANPSDEYSNTLPLCTIDRKTDKNAIDAVDDKMRELMKKQLMQDDGKITWLEYPFGEIIDNVDTHSECEFGSLLIQNYPNKEFLDICIADDGISIPGSYDKYGIDFEDNEEALRMAFEEGISTRPDTGGKRGYGLRTTAEMICSGLGGQVMLSSRDVTLFRNGHTTIVREFGGKSWDGTVFAARIYPPSEDFSYMDYIFPD